MSVNTKLRVGISVAIVAVLWAGCTPSPAEAISPWNTRGVSHKATGEPIGKTVDAARGLGMDCARVDDEPYLVWGCYQTADRYMRLSVQLTSVDRKHVSMVTMVAANSLSLSTEEDPTPYIVTLAEAIIPASYTGPESADLLKSVTKGKPGDLAVFGPIRRSWLGGDDSFHNLTLFFGLFDPPDSSKVFDEFHVEDAWSWGKSVGLECSQGVEDPALGGFEKVRCTTKSGPRAGIDFMLAFAEEGSSDQFSDTDITMCTGRFLSKETGSKEALADIVANLVKRMSDSSDDAARAYDWVMTYAGVKVEHHIGTLNAQLYVTPDGNLGAFGSSIHMAPVGHQAR